MPGPAIAPDGRPLARGAVRLERATAGDVDDVWAALDDPRVWEMQYAGGPAAHSREKVEGILLPSDGRIAYVVRVEGQVVGTTSLGDLDLANERTHIGWTAYSPQAWGGPVNPTCKLLLLGHAFDDCGLGRVKIQTDLLNPRSQAAIAKLGAVREGVLRRHMRRADGTWRDTVVFSVVRDEWPAVRHGLVSRVS